MTDAPSSPIADTTTAPVTTMTKNYEETLESASSKIKSSEEFRSCMDMNVNMCIQNAGMQLAQKNKSAEFCKELTSTEQQESCTFAVTMMNAQEKKDKSLCDVLSDTYKKQCTMSMIRGEATESKDIKICEQIPQSNSGVTTGMRDTARDDCKMNVIMMDMASNVALCNTIDDDGLKDMCKTMLKNRTNLTTPQR
jgi:NAD dependent epimerase/dehydratase family enzyme